MDNKNIIKKIQAMNIKGRIGAIVEKAKDKFNVCIMESYSGGSGVGVMGSICILEIQFKTSHSAEILKTLVNKTFKKEIKKGDL